MTDETENLFYFLASCLTALCFQQQYCANFLSLLLSNGQLLNRPIFLQINAMVCWAGQTEKEKKHGINIVIGIRNKAPKEKVRSRSQSIQFPISWPATEHSDPRNHRITSIKPLFFSLSFKEKSTTNLEWGYYKDRALAKIGGQKKPR